jgi:hypothetical protein
MDLLVRLWHLPVAWHRPATHALDGSATYTLTKGRSTALVSYACTLHALPKGRSTALLFYSLSLAHSTPCRKAALLLYCSTLFRLHTPRPAERPLYCSTVLLSFACTPHALPKGRSTALLFYSLSLAHPTPFTSFQGVPPSHPPNQTPHKQKKPRANALGFR